jgi:hypothetical protein
LIRELIDRRRTQDILPAGRRRMHFRAVATLCLFALAALVALAFPLAGLGICIGCLAVYLKPAA